MFLVDAVGVKKRRNIRSTAEDQEFVPFYCQDEKVLPWVLQQQDRATPWICCQRLLTKAKLLLPHHLRKGQNVPGDVSGFPGIRRILQSTGDDHV
jgi:hypothetical protein